MQLSQPLLRPRFLRLLAAILPCTLFAASSDPVGVLRLKLLGNSDTIVSVPLHRPALVEAQLTVRNGNTLTLDTEIPSLPAGGAYALVMTGALEGAVIPIASKSENTLTLAETDHDLSSLDAGPSDPLLAVIPYWTLDTIFPEGRGVHTSPTAGSRRSEVHFFDDTVAGINHSASAIFYYFQGSDTRDAGWYKVGGALVPVGETAIPPYGYIIVRHRIATDTVLDLAGSVQMAGFRIPIAARASQKDHDNRVSLPVPLPVNLLDSQLVQSGAFRISPTASRRTDELLIFDNTSIGTNKSASAIYYYFVGSDSRPAGWYKVGTTLSADHVLLLPGEGDIIRRRDSESTAPDSWAGTPSYLQ